MTKIILRFMILASILLSGCTSIVTAPIEIAGATAGAVIDIAGSTVHAIVGNDDEEDK